MKGVVFFLSLFVTSHLIAQNQRVSFGPKVGMMIGAPVPHGNAPEDATGKPLLGPNLGLLFGYHFTDKWAVFSELSFHEKGAKFESKLVNQEYIDEVVLVTPDGTVHRAEIKTIFNGKSNGELDNWYLSVPVLARYSFSPKFHLIGGGYYATLVMSNSKTLAEGFAGASTMLTVEEKDLSSEMNETDYGAICGVQYQFKPLVIDFRLSYGFNSIFRSDYKTINYPVRNVYTELSLAYLFLKPRGPSNE